MPFTSIWFSLASHLAINSGVSDIITHLSNEVGKMIYHVRLMNGRFYRVSIPEDTKLKKREGEAWKVAVKEHPEIMAMDVLDIYPEESEWDDT